MTYVTQDSHGLDQNSNWKPPKHTSPPHYHYMTLTLLLTIVNLLATRKIILF